MMINSENNTENDVNGSGSTGEAVASGRGGGATQACLGRYHATAESTVWSRTRKEWTREDNRTEMECYFASEPNKRGYRKRMVNIWKRKTATMILIFEPRMTHIVQVFLGSKMSIIVAVFLLQFILKLRFPANTSINIWRSKNLAQVSEQRLLDQVRQIRMKGWITELEMEEIKRQMANESNRGENERQGESLESDANIRREEIQIECDESVQQANGAGATENTARMLNDEEFSDEELVIAERLFEVLQQPERVKLPALRGVSKSSVKIEVEKMNSLLGRIRSENITVTNDLLYATSVVTTKRLGAKITRKKSQGEPMWKRRLQEQVKLLRKDLSRVEELRKGRQLRQGFKNSYRESTG